MDSNEINRQCIGLCKMLKEAGEVNLYHAADSARTNILMGPRYYDAAAALFRNMYSSAGKIKLHEEVRAEASKLHEILTGIPLKQEELE